MSARYLRSTARAAVLLAATTLAACAVNSPPPPSGGGESSYKDEKAGTAGAEKQSPGSIDSMTVHSLPDSMYFMLENLDSEGDSLDSSGGSLDSTAANYDLLFLEIHSGLTEELLKIERSGKGGTRLAEIQSIVKTAEEFYLEGKPLLAIKLLTEAELLLRQSP